MLPTLDARLSAAAALVREGEAVADIGCDHGKLTAVLAASGKYPKVIGADLRPGPLEKARVTCAPYGDKVQFRLGSGLAVLAPGEAEDIIIGQDWALGPIYFYTQKYMMADDISGAFYTPLGYFIYGYCTKG